MHAYKIDTQLYYWLPSQGAVGRTYEELIPF